MRAKWLIRPALISTGFCSMKCLGVFLLPPGRDTSPLQGYPQAKHYFADSHLYTCVERGTERVKCLAQGHITQSMSLPGEYTVSRDFLINLKICY